jgi:predicted permease
LLVGLQVGLSVALLTGAGLLVRSLNELSRVDPGFDPSRVLAFRVSGNWSENYDDPAGLVQRVDTTVRELAALPGVEGAATSWTLPGAPGPYEIEFDVDGASVDSAQPVIAASRTVSLDYFGVMQIPLVAGDTCRSLPAGIHRPGGPMELMVNRAFADRYFPASPVIGRQLSWESATLSGRVTGVVGNARELGIGSAAVPTVYACDSAPSPFPWYVVRTRGDPAEMAGAVRQRLKELEPLRSMFTVAPLEQLIGGAYAETRLRTVLLAGFAASALLLACLGLYGTLSYVVSLRRREIGLRMAVGAGSGRIVAHFLLKAIRVVGVACIAGLGLAYALSRTLTSLLYGVSPSDPITLVTVVAVVLLVATAAALVPAMRAARIDPIATLKED